MKNFELISEAKKHLKPQILSEKMTAGKVASVLLTTSNNLYWGVSIDAACGLGFCAETNAIGAMITGGESHIKKVCTVKDNDIVSPCGRCRELMIQINSKNVDTEILLSQDKIATLKDLLPEHWLIS